MELNVTDFRRKCQFPLLLILAIMPLILMLASLASMERVYLAWVYAGAYVLLAWIGMLIPGKYRLRTSCVGVAVLIVFGLYLGNNLYLIVAVICGVLLLLSLQMGGWSWSQEVPEFCYWGGLAIHIAMQVLILLAEEWKAYPLLAISGHTVVAFLLFALLALLSMSRSSMVSASMGRHRASVNMRRKNTIMILGFFAVIALLAVLTSPAVAAAAQSVWAFFLYLKSLLPQANQTATQPTETTEPETGDTNELLNSEPSAFFKWLENLFMTVFDFILMIALPLLAIVVVGVVVFLLYKLLRFLYARFAGYVSASSDDYEDVITDTRDTNQKESLGDRLRNSGIFADESKMSPEERIRHRYRMLLRRHPEWGRSTTARENLPEEMAPFYEKARYSGKPMTKNDAAEFSSGIKKV